jgi:hypothetical protein
MKSWGDLLSIDDQIRGFTDTAGLYNLVRDSEVQVLKCIREPHLYGIFRVITLANCEVAYTFYGAGFHSDNGYTYDKWMFDLDLDAEPIHDYINKKSVIVAIKRDISWFRQKAARKGKNIKGCLTAFSAIVFPSPL